MVNNQLKAIYLPRGFREYQSSLWALIEKLIGKGLEVAFSSDNSDVQVLFITTKR
jgi:hypothetical protein